METKILKWARTIALLVIGLFAAYSTIVFYFNLKYNPLPKVCSPHFKMIMGIPGAFLTSLFLVLLLKHHETPIEFKGLSFEFKGASGEIILWVICFLSMVHAIDLLW